MTDIPIKITVNGQPFEASVEPRLTLGGFLRRQLPIAVDRHSYRV
jgi:aerobic-type carbon monoxide dehydrogenase small subunit (CoxS/CutS family)